MKKVNKGKYLLLGIALGVFFTVAILGGAVADRLWGLGILDKLVPLSEKGQEGKLVKERIVDEESMVTQVVEKAAPAVVTWLWWEIGFWTCLILLAFLTSAPKNRRLSAILDRDL